MTRTTRKARAPKPQIATPTEGIVYDPETRDFAIYLDGQIVGFARSYLEADATLSAVKTARAKAST
jgi:hypothetical protein